MDLVSIAVLIIAIAVAALVAALIPALLQLKNTLASAEQLIKNLDSSVKPLLDDEVRPLVRTINGTVGELEGVVKSARDGVEKVDYTLGAIKEVGDTISTINGIINTSIKKSVIELAAYSVGIRTGIGALMDVINRRGQKEV